MQAYSQIVDRTQKIGDLRTLGRRLDLPPGWRYRTRVPAPPARGGRAGRQGDDHPGRAPEHLPARAHDSRAAGPRKRHRVSLDGKTKSVTTTQPGTIEDRGSITRHAVRARDGHAQRRRSAGGRATGTFRLLYPNGSITGSFDMAFTISGGEIDFKGTARFTAGTGAYRGITSGALAAHDHNTLDGQNGVVSVDGFARY